MFVSCSPFENEKVIFRRLGASSTSEMTIPCQGLMCKRMQRRPDHNCKVSSEICRKLSESFKQEYFYGDQRMIIKTAAQKLDQYDSDLRRVFRSAFSSNSLITIFVS
jgi:hypothetical protein